MKLIFQASVKFRAIILIGFVLFAFQLQAQVIEVDMGRPDSSFRQGKIYKVIDVGSDAFYICRVSDTESEYSLFIEGYTKNRLNPFFTSEIKYNEKNIRLVDILYDGRQLYAFTSRFNQERKLTSLDFQAVSSGRPVKANGIEIASWESANDEAIAFKIVVPHDNSKILVTATHESPAGEKLELDFILLKSVGMETLWRKTASLMKPSNSGKTGISKPIPQSEYLHGITIDNNSNIFYCYSEDSVVGKNNIKRALKLGILPSGPLAAAGLTDLAKAIASRVVNLNMIGNYSFSNVLFLAVEKQEFLIGGFFYEMIPGKALLKAGLFARKLDLNSLTIEADSTTLFEDQFLESINSRSEGDAELTYSLDYSFQNDGSVFFIGEQIKKSITDSGISKIDYRDILAAKLGKTGFEWVRSVPIRNEQDAVSQEEYKTYSVISESGLIYILYNMNLNNSSLFKTMENESAEIEKMQSVNEYAPMVTRISIENGSVQNKALRNVAPFLFSTMHIRSRNLFRPSGADLLVMGSGHHEVILYTETAKEGRFCRMKLPD